MANTTATESPYRIGIDLGGTKTEVILLSPDDTVIDRRRRPTPKETHPEKEYRAICDAVTQAARETAARVPGNHPFTIGVGIPGTVQRASGLVQNANTTCLRGHAFQKDLEASLAHPVGMENDANCFAVAEARFGAGRGYGLVFGVIMGTGCGGGLCINGNLHVGRHQIAGEWGHFSVDPRGLRCYCGNIGCIETKISGGGVARSFEATHGRRLTMEQIVTAARAGTDAACTRAFEQFLDDYGRCLGGLISILDPDAVILGGGLSNIAELYTDGLVRVRQYAFHEKIETPILRNQLGDSAGVFGAAWIGR